MTIFNLSTSESLIRYRRKCESASIFLPLMSLFLLNIISVVVIISEVMIGKKKLKVLEESDFIPLYVLDLIFTIPLLIPVYQNKMKGLLPGVVGRLITHLITIFFASYFISNTIALIAYQTLSIFTNVCFALVSKANKLYFICSMFVLFTIYNVGTIYYTIKP